MIKPKFKCGECHEIYDDEEDARDCWRECIERDIDVCEIWACPICHDELSTEKEAMECHDYDPDAPPPPPTGKELEAMGQIRLLP